MNDASRADSRIRAGRRGHAHHGGAGGPPRQTRCSKWVSTQKRSILTERRSGRSGASSVETTTLIASTNLAVSLKRQGKYTEAVEIERKVLVQKARLLGAEHEETLTSATNLAAWLSRCGQKTEAEQLLRNTLFVSRGALGSSHEGAQHVLRIMRSIGLTAR